MKHTKNFISLIIAVILTVMSISVSAYAEDSSGQEITDELLTEAFCKYLDKTGTSYRDDGVIVENKYEINNYNVFFGAKNDCSPALTSKVIDNYVVLSYNIYYPYDIGYFVYNDGEICTLDEAIEKKYFKMSDIAKLSENINLIFDVNFDDEIDMQDAVKLQRIAAKIEPRSEFHYYWVNQNSEMEAVVKVQKYCAKLISMLS